MPVFSSTAAFVQIIKLAVFFATMGLPANPSGIATCTCPSPAAILHQIEAPPSNPRRASHQRSP